LGVRVLAGVCNTHILYISPTTLLSLLIVATGKKKTKQTDSGGVDAEMKGEYRRTKREAQ